MGLRDLTTASMATLSAAWLDPERERPLLAKYKRIAPWIEDIESAHAVLHEVQSNTSAAPEALALLNERAIALDAVHDRKARGLHAALSGFADLSDDPNESAELITLRDELLPSGRSIVNRSYLDQAGEASFVDSRLSLQSKARLQTTLAVGFPLATHVEAWKAAAFELGQVEAERVRLVKESKQATLVSLSKARNTWIAATNALLYAIKGEKGMEEADRRRILEPMETALAKAAVKKVAAGKAVNEGAGG